jgi:hypothetical protein
MGRGVGRRRVIADGNLIERRDIVLHSERRAEYLYY